MTIMEPSDANLHQMIQIFESTQVADPARRKQAEQWLISAQGQAGYLTLLLSFVQQTAINGAPVPDMIRVAAAIQFKNCVKARWFDDNNALAPYHLINEADRNFVKSHLVRAMLETPLAVQRQLSEALSQIAESDFPDQWASLLPELVAHLSSPDLNKVSGVLSTAHTMFKCYRFKGKSEQLWTQIKYVLTNFAKPLLEVCQRLSHELNAAANETTRKQLLNSLTLVANIFLSLSSQDIPAEFEESLKAWMAIFLAMLNVPRPASPTPTSFADDDINEVPDVIDELQAVICQISTLYADKYEEEIRVYIPELVGCVWNLMTKLPPLARHDPVILQALRLLTSVVSKPWHKDLFSSEDKLRAISQSIIVPNMRLRPADYHQFQHNPLEYVRRDSEGSDQMTRRRVTCDLVRALTVHFEAQISAILFKYLEVLLQEYTSDPVLNWVSKDAAMFVILALSVQGQTASKGATQVNAHVNVGEFYKVHVLPELNSADVNQSPVLKADAIKFVSIFRSQLPASECESIIPILIRFLSSSSFVVHSYAASTIERVLALKDCVTRSRLQVHVVSLLTALFNALELEDSSENDYVMKAIMRVCYVAQSDVVPFLTVLLQKLTQILGVVSTNPRNPLFNHYLFETISVLIQSVCAQDKSKVAPFEQVLFTPFQVMLGMESCAEFGPYVFQLMAQLLRLHDTVPAAPYQGMFPMLLTPMLWDLTGNVHALTQLLQVFLSKPGFVGTLTSGREDRLTPVLGVFQKLIASKLHDKHGLLLLRTIIHHVPWGDLKPFFKQILILLLTRLQSSPSSQFTRHFILFIADFICIRGLDLLVTELNQIQAVIAVMVLDNVFIAQHGLVKVPLERKLLLVGLIHVVSKSFPVMTSQAFVHLWPKALDVVLDLIEALADASAAAVTDQTDEAETMLEQLQESGGYSNVYSRLAFATTPDVDQFPGVIPAQLLSASLTEGCRHYPAKIPAMITETLPLARQEFLKTILQKYGGTIV